MAATALEELRTLMRPGAVLVLETPDTTGIAPGDVTDHYEVFFQEGPQGSGPIPHSHPWDESFFVIRGAVDFSLVITPDLGFRVGEALAGLRRLLGAGGDLRIERGEFVETLHVPTGREVSFEAFRGYYDYLPRGRHVVEYTLRLNNPGRFALPPTRVEAMYAPETFGELPNAAVEVAP